MNDFETREEFLLAHAAGRLDPAVCCVITTHLALCSKTSSQYRQFQAIAGILLEQLDPEPLASDCLDRVVSRIDRGGHTIKQQSNRATKLNGIGCCTDPDIPQPLASMIDGKLRNLPWGRFGPVSEIELETPSDAYRLTLLRLKAGRAAPKHTHRGQELTVVLRGSFQDGIGEYHRGDLSIADGMIDHQPVAGPEEDCYALAVTDAPLQLTGAFSRLLNPLMQ